MANGDFGTVYWTVRYKREDTVIWTKNEARGGIWPTQAEANTHMPILLAELNLEEPEVIHEVVANRVFCGELLPGE